MSFAPGSLCVHLPFVVGNFLLFLVVDGGNVLVDEGSQKMTMLLLILVGECVVFFFRSPWFSC